MFTSNSNQCAFFSRSGELSTRLNLKASGVWDGKSLTLKEHLKYDSGETHERVFIITKKDEHTYEAKCDEFVGVGLIKSLGNTLHWQYTLKENSQQAKGITLKFDDWMFLNQDGTITNRAQATKWGFYAGEIQLSINKTP